MRRRRRSSRTSSRSSGPLDGWWPPATPRGPAVSTGRGRSAFGRSWWGRAWIDALEHRARLDPNRLPRGRTYARTGAVGELLVATGEVRAPVQGSRPRPYEVHIRVRQFTDTEWQRVVAAVASRAGHAAALLDGELTPGVAADAAAAGVALLPEAGELVPRCTCPDWADPCKHAAAVCYLMADRMDTDPFTILLLRGRSRDQVLAGVRRQRAAGTSPAGAPSADAIDRGVPAASVFTASRATVRSSLPALPPPPSRPGTPASLPVDPPASSPVSALDLAALAADAARRAWELCRGDGDGGLGLSLDADIARLAEQRVGGPDFDRFAARANVPPRTLMRHALAWRAGGAAGLEVLQEPIWSPEPESMRDAVHAARERFGAARIQGNRVTTASGALQLRLGRDSLWYLLERRSGVWELCQPPSADCRALLDIAQRT